MNRLYTETLERIRRIPGVVSAAVALTLPYERPLNNSMQVADGDGNRHARIEAVYATPGYFDTMRIPAVRGARNSGVRTPRKSAARCGGQPGIRGKYLGKAESARLSLSRSGNRRARSSA